MSLVVAAEGNQVDVVRRFIVEGADVNATDEFGQTPLYIAAHKGNVALLLVLMDAGADPNKSNTRGTSPLHMASMEGHAECGRVSFMVSFFC